MNRSKSILLAATALTLLATAGAASAQSAPGAAVVFLPVPAGAASSDTGASAISADGTTVLGEVDGDYVVWVNGVPAYLGRAINPVSGFTNLHDPSQSRPAFSANGQVALFGDGAGPQSFTPVIWTRAGGASAFTPTVGSGESIGLDLSLNGDGTVAAFTTSSRQGGAFGTSGSATVFNAYRWTQAGGAQNLGQFPIAAAGVNQYQTYGISAIATSGDGNTIAGDSTDQLYAVGGGTALRDNRGAFRWTSTGGLERLANLSASPVSGTVAAFSQVLGISRDGSSVLGLSRDAAGLDRAVYWRGTAPTSLGFLSGQTQTAADSFSTYRMASNADGSLIVGGLFSAAANSERAWRWTATSGMQDINLIAANAGLNLNGFVLNDAVGVSDDGQYITGNASNSAQSQSRGYVLSIAAAPSTNSSAQALFLPASSGTPAAGSFSSPADTFVNDISADGTIVAGADVTGAVRWTNGAPETVANYKVHLGSINVSGDGLTVLSNTLYSPLAAVRPGPIRPYLWSQSGGYREIPFRSASEDFVPDFDIDTTGRFITVNTVEARQFLDARGFQTGKLQDRYRAYRWTEAGGYQSLGEFAVPADDPNRFSQWGIIARAISGDGRTIAGDTLDTKYNVDPVTFAPDYQAPVLENFGGFVWTEASGLQRLPDLSASKYSFVGGISRDGGTIVGASRGADGFVQAVYWQGGSVSGLGYLPGASRPTSATVDAVNSTFALAANADGSVIVGRANGATVAADKAWRWTTATGMQDLNIFAQNAGLNLNGFVLNDAVGVSDTGQYITGNSFNATLNRSLGYVLSIAAAPPPPTTLSTTARLIVTLTLPGVTQTSIVNQSFSTQVDGLLNGRNVFTRTVADQITGAGGVTALADARTALQVGGGLRRLVIGAPVLVSNTTTVQSSTSNTVNVASGTLVTTAAVVTNGPATVATGDLGTCATAATNGVNPTGCSLPGTPVTVNTNVINTNTFTNTINSVTPTTTTTVNQLVSAKWQVSATAGNQFGTVHALVGPAAFERGDRLIGQLIDLGGAGGSSPVTRAAVGGVGLTMFGGYFGNWTNIDADSRVPVAQVRGNTDGFVLGLEKALGGARIGVAVDHGTSSYDVRDATYPETLSMKHTQLGLFANWQSGGFALDGAAAYGFGTVRTTLTTPTTPATASRDVRSWSLGAQAGYGFQIDATTVRLVAGLRHTSAKLNAFTETGGPTPLAGLAKTVQRTRVYGGVEVTTRLKLGGITLTPRVHARAASDSGDASGTADLVFAGAPNGPVMQAVGPGVGRTVAELGGSLDAAVGGNVHLWAGYDGSFRSGARSHAVKAGMTIWF